MKQFVIFSLLSAAIPFSPCSKAQEQPVTIPLTLMDVATTGSDTNLGFVQRLVIYVGIGNGLPEPYLFDTGSPNFVSAYSPAIWDTNAVVSTVSYDASTFYYKDSQGYLFNEDEVNELRFYSNASISSYVTNLQAPSTTNNFLVGAVSEHLFPTNSDNPTGQYTNITSSSTNVFYFDTNFSSAVSNGIAPLHGALFGTFGAGMFTGVNRSGTNADGSAATFTAASILGQATTSGYVVSANSTNPSITLGLNQSIRDQFTTKLDWNTTLTNSFPVSGANAGTESDVNFDYSVASSDHGTNWTATGTLLDSGTPDNTVNVDSNSVDLENFINSNGELKDGAVFTARASTNAASPNSLGIYSFTATNDVSPDTYSAKVSSGSNGETTIGIGFFLTNSVMFDLQNGQTGYTAATVVPEPSSTVFLLISGSIFAMEFLSRRRISSSRSLGK